MCALFGEDGTTLDVDADAMSVRLMRFANGMVASVLTSAVAFWPNFRSFEVFGSDGSVSYEGMLMAERERVRDQTGAHGYTDPARRALVCGVPRREIPRCNHVPGGGGTAIHP